MSSNYFLNMLKNGIDLFFYYEGIWKTGDYIYKSNKSSGYLVKMFCVSEIKQKMVYLNEKCKQKALYFSKDLNEIQNQLTQKEKNIDLDSFSAYLKKIYENVNNEDLYGNITFITVKKYRIIGDLIEVYKYYNVLDQNLLKLQQFCRFKAKYIENGLKNGSNITRGGYNEFIYNPKNDPQYFVQFNPELGNSFFDSALRFKNSSIPKYNNQDYNNNNNPQINQNNNNNLNYTTRQYKNDNYIKKINSHSKNHNSMNNYSLNQRNNFENNDKRNYNEQFTSYNSAYQFQKQSTNLNSNFDSDKISYSNNNKSSLNSINSLKNKYINTNKLPIILNKSILSFDEDILKKKSKDIISNNKKAINQLKEGKIENTIQIIKNSIDLLKKYPRQSKQGFYSYNLFY